MTMYRCTIYFYLLLLGLFVVNNILTFIFGGEVLITFIEIGCFCFAVYTIWFQAMAFGDSLRKSDRDNYVKRDFDEERHARMAASGDDGDIVKKGKEKLNKM